MASQIIRQTSDQIGDFGELLVETVLSRPVLARLGVVRPLFRAVRLGGKYPAADFLVDVLGDENECVGFFFVQVKSTTKTGGSRRLRLPITADLKKLNLLARLPVPAYIIGVDITSEQCYLAPAFTPWETRVYTITKRYPLVDEQVRTNLFDEVCRYWSVRQRRAKDTRFKNA